MLHLLSFLPSLFPGWVIVAIWFGGGAALNDNRISFLTAAPLERGQRLILGGCRIDNRLGFLLV